MSGLLHRLCLASLALIALLPLGGCFLGMAAATAGTSYAVGKEYNRYQDYKVQNDQKQLEWRSREIANSKQNVISIQDAETISQLNQRFVGGGLTPVMTVHSAVNNGVVTLNGRVPSRVIADRAVAIAREMPDVEQVISNLMIVDMMIVPASSGGSRMSYHQAQPAVSATNTGVAAGATTAPYSATTAPTAANPTGRATGGAGQLQPFPLTPSR